MARHKNIKKRPVIADFKYNSVLVTMFINKIMKDGKKHTAQKIFYKTLDVLKAKNPEMPELDTLSKAIKNIAPVIILKTRRVGGANYQVPTEVDHNSGHVIAIKWILAAAKERKEHTMYERLSAELLAAAKNEPCASVKRKENMYKMAESNKAFAHYRWN